MNNSALEIAFQAVRMYAETRPRPPHVTQRQAAEMLNLSAPTIHKLVKSGKLRLNDAGLIPITEIDAIITLRGQPAG